ncbi:hypothetical protein D3C79_840790 [compost metagenome]
MGQLAAESQPLAPHVTAALVEVGIQQQGFQLIVLQAVQLERLAVLDVRLVEFEPHLEAAIEEIPGGLAIEAQQLGQLQSLLLPPFRRQRQLAALEVARSRHGVEGWQPVGGIGEQPRPRLGIEVAVAVGGERVFDEQVLKQPRT